MAGWIKLHKKMKNWEWYTDHNTFILFMHILLTVEYEDSRFRGHDVPRGAMVAGINKLSEETGLSIQNIRTSINKLKSTGEITVKSTNKFSIINVCNFNEYQKRENDDQQTNQQANQQTSNKPLTTSKEIKKEKKEEINSIGDVKKKNGKFIRPSLEEVTTYCLERNNGLDPQYFLDSNDSKGWVVGKSPMKDWKAAIRTWEKNAIRFNENKKPKGQIIGGIEFE